MKEPGSLLKKFTRILHRSADDELMDEIPTIRIDPDNPHCELWCDFPVKDRPTAVLQWLDKDNENDVKYKYIMMGEPDYVFIKPITAWHIPPQGEATAFRYGYINPDYPTIKHITTRIYNNATVDVPEPYKSKNTDITKVPGTHHDISKHSLHLLLLKTQQIIF